MGIEHLCLQQESIWAVHKGCANDRTFFLDTPFTWHLSILPFYGPAQVTISAFGL